MAKRFNWRFSKSTSYDSVQKKSFYINKFISEIEPSTYAIDKYPASRRSKFCSKNDFIGVQIVIIEKFTISKQLHNSRQTFKTI